jgi:class 3 adenylate cyclase
MKAENYDDLISLLKDRFEKNMLRHKGITWDTVAAKLEVGGDKLKVLAEMEKTGGEPDVVLFDKKTDEFVFCDCSAETPIKRRGLCYDKKGFDSRKEHKPEGNAVDLAASIGAEMLDEEQYRALQELGEFDLKTSSWIRTPDAIRSLGGAIFCDRRYNYVFTYHNGADSYYSSRGFRTQLKI